ncbi:hypothetical protein J6X13_02845 [Candidatus Saccharibacteria bacterium]|nr:hypothetical protein [Candidatus Saccharibacteria bacterium]
MNNEDQEPKTIHGGRNLIILGFSVAVIAIISTAISLHIYRETGDVYLDRSRPGYIFEDEKHDTDDDKKELFSADGEIDASVLDQYLKEFDTVMDRIEDASNDFSPEPISNESLSIDIVGHDEDFNSEENNF